MNYFRNQAHILGNLTEDPQLKYTPNKNPYCKTSVATNRNIKKKDSEEWESVVTFHNITIWGKTAEWFVKNFKKGHKVAVYGRIQNTTYEDKNGIKKYYSEIVAYDIVPMVANKIKYSKDTAIQKEIDKEHDPEKDTSPFVTADDLPF